jgi:hypothetical protein
MRYRRSLVSKGRFTISINVICVGIRSSLPKRRYRVVMGYVGDLLRHRGKLRQGRVLVVSWVMSYEHARANLGGETSCLWVFVVVAASD